MSHPNNKRNYNFSLINKVPNKKTLFKENLFMIFKMKKIIKCLIAKEEHIIE